MKNIIFNVIMLVTLSGCAYQQYTVTFDTTPQSAALVCSGKNYGYTPVVIYYDKDEIHNNKLNVSNCKAIWSSGVSRAYPAKLNVFSSGATVITLARPKTDGYTQDAEFDLKVKKLKTTQKIANVIEQKNKNGAIPSPSPSLTQTVTCKKVTASLTPETKLFPSIICPTGWLPL